MRGPPASIRLSAAVFFAAVLVALAGPPVLAEAFDTGATRIVPDDSVFVNGSRVTSPQKTITLDTRWPLFKGSTTPDTRVYLSTSGDAQIGGTVTDAQGNWTIRGGRALASGVHPLDIEFKDRSGVSSGVRRLATIEVPFDLASATQAVSLPSESLTDDNGVAFGLLVLSVVATLLVIYLASRWITRLF